MGRNDRGQLGDGATNRINQPEKIVAGGVTAIAAGAHQTLFLESNGSLWAMGLNGDEPAGDGSQHAGPQMIVAGGVAHRGGCNHCLFVKTDGSLWAMGDDSYGQLGDQTRRTVYASGKIEPEQIVAGQPATSTTLAKY